MSEANSPSARARVGVGAAVGVGSSITMPSCVGVGISITSGVGASVGVGGGVAVGDNVDGTGVDVDVGTGVDVGSVGAAVHPAASRAITTTKAIRKCLPIYADIVSLATIRTPKCRYYAPRV